MNNKTTTFEVRVDYYNLKQTSVYTELQKKIYDYNVKHRNILSRESLYLEIEIDNKLITENRLDEEIVGLSRTITGIAPYEDVIENKIASYVVNIKDSDIKIETQGCLEAKESSSLVSDCVFRAFVTVDTPDYKDFKSGKCVRKGSFARD